MNIEKKLKNNLKEIRVSKGLSQERLAKLIGVSRNTISSIETNMICPNTQLALMIARVLEKNLEEIFYL